MGKYLIIIQREIVVEAENEEDAYQKALDDLGPDDSIAHVEEI